MRILAAIDGSKESEKVTKALKQFPESDVTVVKIIDPQRYLSANVPIPTNMDRLAYEEIKDQIDNISQYHTVNYRIEFGNPKVMLAHDMPELIKADLIVISRTGLNAVERILIGSTANYVATHAKIPVLIV